MQELSGPGKRITDSQQSLFFILLVIVLLSSLFFKPSTQFSDLYFVNLKAHFFQIAPAIFIILFFVYVIAFRITLNFNKIDILLIIYALYSLINYAIHDFGYNENLTTFVLSIFTILLLKQLYYKIYFGIYIIYGCFFLIILFGFYEFLYGELQILGYRPSHHKLFTTTGTFQNPGPYAIFLSPVFIVSLAIILFPPTHPVLSKILIISCWFTLIGISIILPATQSRSAWIGTLIGSQLVIYIRYKAAFSTLHSKTKPVYRVAIALTVFLIFLAGSYLLYQYKPESAEGRALVWRLGSGSLLLPKNVFFGIGFEQFKANFGNLQSEFM
jgi:O-antigen polymerase